MFGPSDLAGSVGRVFGKGPSRRRERAPGIQLDCHADRSVKHVGIVFVHGIGNQAPGETLLQWGGAIIGALLDARVGRKASADPVIDSQLDPDPGRSRYIELQLPPVDVDGTVIDEQHWVMTEAWWAQRVRPPSFGQMAEWLGPRGAIRRIAMALLPRGDIHDARMRASAEVHPLRRADGLVEEAVAAGPPLGMASMPSERGRSHVRRLAQVFLQALSALVLLLYGVLRSVEKLIPIGPLRDGALTRPIDDFMLEWFGDVFVLLNNPAETASVRGRLMDSLNDLQAIDCDEITVIAHSGGAIVSHLTLIDPTSAHLRVDRLVTHGEAVNLAWRLTAGDDSANRDDAEVRFERLYRNLLNAPHRETMAWHDFWASKDPAPVGVLQIPRDRSMTEDEDARTLSRIQSHAIWNRLSLGEDHGNYWDNDEEYLLPLLRILENRSGKALFGGEEQDERRSNLRRRRLSLRSLWLQTSLIAPLAAVIAVYLTGTRTLIQAGNAAASVWSSVPGNELLSDAINGIRAARWQESLVGGFLAETGVWVIAIAILLAAIYSVIDPPERPIPWAGGSGRARLMKWFLESVPLITFIVIVISLGLATYRFIVSSSPAGVDVGGFLLRVVVAVVAGALTVWAMFGRLADAGDRARGRWRNVRDVAEIAITVALLAGAVVLVASPIIALAVFEDVGRTVLGIAAVVLAFQVLARIGTWRWAVWDQRERMAARTGRSYPGVARALTQSVLLTLTLAALLVGVILNVAEALLLALGIGAATVLLGIAVDVLDAARLERRAE